MPIEKYDGSSDPEEHLNVFLTQATLSTQDDSDLCRIFPTSLKGRALSWFTRLPSASIDSFGELSSQFTLQFATSKPYKTTSLALAGVREDERIEPTEDLRPFQLGKTPEQITNMGSQLSEADSRRIKGVVRDNRDLFAWRASDMPGIDPKFLCHRLAVCRDARPVVFLGAYSGYNQIRMHPSDEEKTTFITENTNFCYRVMPFGLKNAGATYQRLMEKVFQGQIGRNIEIYVDDMVVKSNSLTKHITDLAEIFGELRKHNMRLNPEKCTFGVKGGKFLGFMLSPRGIEANRDKCQAALNMRSPSNLKELQRLSGRLVALSRFLPRPILVYLAVSEEAISSVLVQEREGNQAPVYFVSRLLQDSETRYQLIEKSGARSIVVHTDCPIAKVLRKPELAGRMMAWSIELSQFDITFKPRGPIKAQCLADFINELHPQGQFEEPWWTLHVDGSSNSQGSGAGVILEGPRGITLEQSLRFRFKASNNQAEYEALLAGLRLAEDMGASKVKCRTDSKVVAEQEVSVEHIPRKDNARADQLARLAATKKPGHLRTIIQQEIDRPSVDAEVVANVNADCADQDDSQDWRAKIKEFLVNGNTPTDPSEAKRLRTQAGRYVVIADQLYKRGFSTPLLKCLNSAEADYVTREVHEGICELHSGARTTISKLLRAGYYWTTMNTDYAMFIKKCLLCQKHGNLVHQPAEQLHCIPPAWLFATWGADILEPFPVAKGQCKFLIVAVDLFTKWIEAEPLACISAHQVQKFLWKNIITRFGSTTLETPFWLVYGSDAMIPVEIGEPSFRRAHFNEASSEAELRTNLDTVEEIRDRALVVAEATKQRSRVFGRFGHHTVYIVLVFSNVKLSTVRVDDLTK
uniref:Retrovirus-related Pol polyprotein from transposon 17.6 n=1 Tax=Cajanus cajan TaxID=3821 RepID=A0A151RNB8_CAJCA|nr:Retrovirus-related Pol polyprotein from transposon 17.6 [Cajanus cajan]